MPKQEAAPGPSLLMRLVAIVVLLVAGWILLKWVIGVLAGIATLIVIALAAVAVIWAIRTL